MSERQNNHTDWVTRINTLDALPGEAHDHSAAWEKLQSRLHHKKKKAIPFWYWLAAACIIILFLLPFTKNKTPHQESSIVQQETKKNPITKSKNIASLNIITDSVKAPAPAVNIHKTRINKTNHIIHPVIITKEEITVVPNVTPAQVAVRDTNLKAQTIAVSNPKKLRVIHINELIYPVGEQQVMAGNNNDNPINYKAPYKEKFSRMQLGNNSTDNILKINISPTN